MDLNGTTQNIRYKFEKEFKHLDIFFSFKVRLPFRPRSRQTQSRRCWTPSCTRPGAPAGSTPHAQQLWLSNIHCIKESRAYCRGVYFSE